MKKFLIIIVFIVIQNLFAQEWYKLTSLEANCSIDFPNKPISKVDFDLDNYAKIMRYLYKLKDRNTDYQLNIYFLKSELKDEKSYLLEKINQILKESKGEKKDFLELNIDDILGYEMDVELNDNYSLRVRVFYHNKKYYELIAIMPTERMNTSDINMFMNSFKINAK